MRRKLILIFVDVILIVLAYLGSFVLRFEFKGTLDYVHFIETSLPIIIVVTIPVFIRTGMYRAVWRYASVDCLVISIKAITISTLVSVVLVYFLQTYRMPRSIFIIYWFLFMVGAGGIRFSTRIYRHYYTANKKNGRRVLIYGAGAAGQMVAKEMRGERSLGFTPVCFVDDDPAKAGMRLHGLPIYSGGEMDNLSVEHKIQAELKGIPKDKLPEIYDLIHYFRKGVEEERAEDAKVLRLASENKFAEVWKGEKDDVWESYL